MCDCISGNVPHLGGSDVSVVLTVPEGLSEAGRAVAVDACIQEAVRAVWAAGVSTRSNCCGHNGQFPRHIMVFKPDAGKAREALDSGGWNDIPIAYWDGETVRNLTIGDPPHDPSCQPGDER